jgi:3-dehydroquinate dehydratase/shikimate dehydrogenase
MPMLCVTIKGPTFDEAAQQILSVPLSVNLLEFRLDYFHDITPAMVQNLREIRALPVIFTLRDSNRLKDIEAYARLNPEYFDLEHTLPKEFVEAFIREHPHIKVIYSYHNFEETPSDLETVYRELESIPAHLYKIATQCRSSIDALKLMLFCQSKAGALCAMGMGEEGELTRVLGPVYHSPITYSSVTDALKVVSGQLTATTLVNTYQFPTLNTNTSVYGLFGDPVSKSIGNITHNAYFRHMHIPAVYVKIKVSPKELKEALQLTKKLGFKGLSVTMPLKEDLLPLVDVVDPYTAAIGAANTLVFASDGIHAYNTDGIGALNAIEKLEPVKGKKIIILGAGGAAKAIIVEALNRGAQVTVLNRTVKRAAELAERYAIEAGALEDAPAVLKAGYDILINCTPEELPISPALLEPGKVVMDIKTRPPLTKLLEEALTKGCTIVYGYQMYIEQALEQYALWFPETFNRIHAKELLEHETKLILEKR